MTGDFRAYSEALQNLPKIYKTTTPWQILDLESQLLHDVVQKTRNLPLGSAEFLKIFPK